jgi:hypothetical protein
VQHHLAHAAAVLGEHGVSRAWRTGERHRARRHGHGPDGTTGVRSGCSDLRRPHVEARRAARDALPLVGGERAVREPWRVTPYRARGAQRARGRCFRSRRTRRARSCARPSRRSAGRGVPMAFGAGRLFEAAGALLGLASTNTYEGEAAARCEALASHVRTTTVCPLDGRPNAGTPRRKCRVTSPAARARPQRAALQAPARAARVGLPSHVLCARGRARSSANCRARRARSRSLAVVSSIACCVEGLRSELRPRLSRCTRARAPSAGRRRPRVRTSASSPPRPRRGVVPTFSPARVPRSPDHVPRHPDAARRTP